MQVYDFSSYQEYVNKNIELNLRKYKNRNFKLFKFKPVADYALSKMSNIEFGICHGVRDGQEVMYFSDMFKCTVIGTEISHTASEFPNVIQWDFHEVKPEWVNGVDFIYSNSTDHSHSFKYCIAQWITCLKNTGLCFIEHDTDKFSPSINAGDCFSASKDEYRDIFKEIGCYYDEFNIQGDKMIFVLNKAEINPHYFNMNLFKK